MGDTSLVPDDGITAGSRTTPSTVPAVRQGAAAARELLVGLACQRWSVDPEHGGRVRRQDRACRQPAQRSPTPTWPASGDAAKAFEQSIPDDVTLTPVDEWKVLGTSVPRPNRRDLVTGAHQFPSDLVAAGHAVRQGAAAADLRCELMSVDLGPAKAMKGVVAVQDGIVRGRGGAHDVPRRQAL